MTLPLMVLAVLSVFLGWIETPPILGGIHALSDFLRLGWAPATFWTAPSSHPEISHATEWVLVILTSVVSLSVAYLSYRIHSQRNHQRATDRGFVLLSRKKFWVDEVYEILIVRPLRVVGQGAARWIDEGLIDSGVSLGRSLVFGGGRFLSLFHNGSVQAAAWFLAAATAGIVLWSLFGQGAAS
jgi:NADH-quinone oxidoreductase subunit L